MKKDINIEDMLKSLSTEDMPPDVSKIAEETFEAFTKTLVAQGRLIWWRKIMKSKITKLAAAALIVSSACLALYFGVTLYTAGVAYGISDVPRLLRNAKSLHLKGSSTRCLKGQEPVPCPMEYWMDFENLRYRRRAVYEQDANHYSGYEVVFDAAYRMNVDHTTRTVRFFRHSPFRSLFILRIPTDRDVFMRNFYLETDALSGFEKAGQEKINGVLFDIWEKKVDRPEQRTTKYWINPSTGELGRYFRRYLQDHYIDKATHRWVLLDEDKQEWHEDFLTCIERDKPFSDDVFRLDAPAGYAVTTSKDQAPALSEEKGLPYHTFPSVPNTTAHLCYELTENGSVIAAWTDRNPASSESRATAFAGLTPGGPLPELTFVPYALHPNYFEYREKNDGITYIGRHLAYTKKGNLYYEWTIYVLGTDPPKKRDFGGVLPYDVLVRRNPDDGQTRRVAFFPDTTITSAKEFDGLVLGGMAEFSDDGKPPEGLTYEGVLELARRIRESLSK